MGIYGKLQALDKEKPSTVEAITPMQERPEPPAERKPDSVSDSKIARKHDSTLSRYLDNWIEPIRKAVKLSGKDPFFGRFTPEEKSLLADIAYTYKRRGIKTSENEIARIAIHHLLNDYQQNGKSSVLARVLKALYE
jgi:hypothetical protein